MEVDVLYGSGPALYTLPPRSLTPNNSKKYQESIFNLSIAKETAPESLVRSLATALLTERVAPSTKQNWKTRGKTQAAMELWSESHDTGQASHTPPQTN